MVIIIDNIDSFVHNLGRYIERLGYKTQVFRNNKLSIQEIASFQPTHIILSPGPCSPNEAGISLEIVKTFSGKIPILGVCLGHQVIAQAFGAKIVRANRPLHGQASRINHSETGLFWNLPQLLKVGRYHSLIVQPESLPSCLNILAWSEEKEIMAISHKEHLTFGVQFHPESVLTEQGEKLLQNFFQACMFP